MCWYCDIQFQGIHSSKGKLIEYKYNDDRPGLLIDFVICRMGGSLLHITDKSDLMSIEDRGLLSENERREQCIIPSYYGGTPLTRTLDNTYGLSKYVFLGFSKNSIMPKHDDAEINRHLYLLHIDPEILRLPGTKIALGRANHRDTTVRDVRYAAHLIEWDLLAGKYDWDDLSIRPAVFRSKNYEALIPCSVPSNFVTGIEQL